MKLACAQNSLSSALALVNRAVSPNNTLPVLNNILLKVEGRRLHLSATNLEIAISASFEVEVENEGTLTVPAKSLSSYVALLNDKDVHLSVTGGNTLVIQGKGSTTKMKGIASEEFPNLPRIDKPEILKFPTARVAEALTQVSFAASTNISRPVLTGIFWQVKGKVLKLAATDSYRLGEKTLILEKDLEKDLNFIVPTKTVQELERILAASAVPEFEVHVGKGQVLFKVDGVELTSRLIEGAFPDYERIIPKETKTQMVLSNDAFTLGLKQVSVLVRENSNNVKVKTQKDSLVISSDETQVGQGSAEIPAQVTGDSVETALNVQYLLDVLARLNSKEVHLSLNDGLSPVMVTPTSGGDYIHIIMPLKV